MIERFLAENVSFSELWMALCGHFGSVIVAKRRENGN